MKLNHRQLQAFRALIETGSVTEAAKRINVTQPATSRLISDLEHCVGYALFLREKKRLYPTPEALALFEEVERSFIGLDAIAEAARDIGNFRRGSLRLVGLPAMALDFLPQIISQFCQDRPDISISLQIQSSQSVVQSVASQQFDIGFAEIETEHPAVISSIFYAAPMMAVLPKGHELLERTVLTPKDFQGRNFVSFNPEYTHRKLIDAIFLAKNITRKIQIETQLSMAIGSIVASGAGISIIDPVTATSLKARGLIETRPFIPEISYLYRMLLPSHKPLSSLGEAFLNNVGQTLKKNQSGAQGQT